MRTAWWGVVLAVLGACAGGEPGPQGLRGPAGPMGERGPTGPAGGSYRPVYWVSCLATLDLLRLGAAGAERGADGTRETSLNYALIVYSNGDAEAQCSAAIGSSQDGSSSAYYPSSTKGAASGLCIASADFGSVPVGEVGFWSFDVATAACPRAAYVDADNPLGLNGYSYKYSESDCTAKMMNAGGEWTPVTLSDVF